MPNVLSTYRWVVFSPLNSLSMFDAEIYYHSHEHPICSQRCGLEKTMSIHEFKKDDNGESGSKTYVEFYSDSDSEAEREAYRLISRGGRLREGVEDINELYAELAPLLADVLFEDDPVPLMEWLEIDEDDWERYQDES